MTATWNDVFFASELDFDRLSPEEMDAGEFYTPVRSNQQISGFFGSVATSVVGMVTAVALCIGAPDMSRLRVVQGALDDEVAAAGDARVELAVPDDVLVPRPQNHAGLARILRLGKRTESLDHLV